MKTTNSEIMMKKNSHFTAYQILDFCSLDFAYHSESLTFIEEKCDWDKNKEEKAHDHSYCVPHSSHIDSALQSSVRYIKRNHQNSALSKGHSYNLKSRNLTQIILGTTLLANEDSKGWEYFPRIYRLISMRMNTNTIMRMINQAFI